MTVRSNYLRQHVRLQGRWPFVWVFLITITVISRQQSTLLTYIIQEQEVAQHGEFDGLSEHLDEDTAIYSTTSRQRSLEPNTQSLFRWTQQLPDHKGRRFGWPAPLNPEPKMTSYQTGLTRYYEKYLQLIRKNPQLEKEFEGNVPRKSTIQHPDPDCIFKDSPLYSSIYVYPSPGEEEWDDSTIRSAYSWNADNKQEKEARNSAESGVDDNEQHLHPWQIIDNYARNNSRLHYDATKGQGSQYSTELLIRELMTNPKSCLRTYDPDQATLFYVPYLPSTEFHNSTLHTASHETSPFAQAILDAMEGSYAGWEQRFGLTSKYWKQRYGSDHILVMSEPCHGLWHPRGRRGNFVYLKAQHQTKAPIIVSVELSTTFVSMYPNCARKNIVLPYPNIDGTWFNTKLDQRVQMLNERRQWNTITQSPSSLLAEQTLYKIEQGLNNQVNENITGSRTTHDYSLFRPRPLAQAYGAGNHGTCKQLRVSMAKAYEGCSESSRSVKQLPTRFQSFAFTYRQATFCPCPGGDTPSAKRMFDAVLAGCIPVVLSEDFVWPFTSEVDPFLSTSNNEEGSNRNNYYNSTFILNPIDFSIRLQASEFMPEEPCSNSGINQTIQAYLDRIPSDEIARLRKGVEKAAAMYGWYQYGDTSLPDNPLREGVLPNGGLAHAFVQALADRAEGNRWPACEAEMTRAKNDEVKIFKC